MSTVWLSIFSSFPPTITPSAFLYNCYPPCPLSMSSPAHELHSACTVATPTAPATPQAPRGHKQLQLNAEETTSKCSNSDATQEDPNTAMTTMTTIMMVTSQRSTSKGKGKGTSEGKENQVHGLASPPLIF